MTSLRWWHVGAALAHAAQVGQVYGSKWDGTMTEYDVYQRVKVPETKDGKTDDRVSAERRFSYNIRDLLGAFPALSTVNHLYASVLWDDYQSRVLKTGVNPVRWAEYSVSAGLMYVILAQLSGVDDANALLLLLSSNVVLQWFGYEVEREPDLQRKKRLQYMGFTLFVGTWIPIFLSFFTALADSPQNPPTIVYFIIFILFGLFLCFGIVSWLSMMWPTEKREKAYIVLSLAAKTSLVQMVYFGLRRT